MKFEQIIEEFKIVLNKINLQEMANKQGTSDGFTYITLDNEYVTHYPHVHVCVLKNDKYWNGKVLKNKSEYKTTGSIQLNGKYEPQEIVFEEIIDEKLSHNRNRKKISNWLKSQRKSKITGISFETNAERCLDDYLTNNETVLNKQFLKDYKL